MRGMTRRRWMRAGLGVVVAALLVGSAAPSSVGAASDKTDEAHAMAVQPDGKVLVAGRSLNALHNGNWTIALARYNPDGNADFALIRYNADGSLVGSITTDFDGIRPEVRDLRDSA